MTFAPALAVLPELGPGWAALGLVGLGYSAYAGYRRHQPRSQSSHDGTEADNKGFLGRGRDARIIAARIRSLEGQIDNFKRQLEACEKANAVS